VRESSCTCGYCISMCRLERWRKEGIWVKVDDGEIVLTDEVVL